MRTGVSTRVLRRMNTVWSFMEHSSESRQLVSKINQRKVPSTLSLLMDTSIRRTPPYCGLKQWQRLGTRPKYTLLSKGVILKDVKIIPLKSILFYTFLHSEPPSFSSKPPPSVKVSSIEVTIRVNCSATGSPLPKITWYKNNVSIPLINNVTIDEVTSELVIGQFHPSDQATYTCVARNMYNDEVRIDTKIGKRNQYIKY